MLNFLNFTKLRFEASIIPRQFFQNMTHKVFVYGTLKHKEPNHHWLSESKNGVSNFLGIGKTRKKYPLIIGTKYNIPFILYKPGIGYHIQGEVYEVDDQMLENLDILEDHPNYYVREMDDIEIQKSADKEELIKCWIYFLKNFKEHLLSKQMLENYSSSGGHGLRYLERSYRDPTYDHYSDVKKT